MMQRRGLPQEKDNARYQSSLVTKFLMRIKGVEYNEGKAE